MKENEFWVLFFLIIITTIFLTAQHLDLQRFIKKQIDIRQIDPNTTKLLKENVRLLEQYQGLLRACENQQKEIVKKFEANRK